MMSLTQIDVRENEIFERSPELLSALLNDYTLSTEALQVNIFWAAGKQLFYHAIPTSDGEKYYEIDFLIADEFKVSPIEVKSSGYKSHTSLDVFCKKFSDRVQNKYVIYAKDLKREKGIDYIPVYMTMFL